MEIMNINHITKIYDELTSQPIMSLNDVSLNIEKGDFICIMGASGSGKSTFIHCISTMDTPTKGTVQIFDRMTTDMTEEEIGKIRNQKIGFVFQDYQLLDYLTIQQNIAFPLSMMNHNNQEIITRVKELAQQFNVEDILYKYPNECSGGQKQRVAIARALVNDPEIIIADEPTGNLDSINTKEVLKIFKDLHQQQKTMIMVTHDSLVASYSSKMIYIKDGSIGKTLLRSDFATQKDYYYQISKINENELLELLD